VYASAHDLVRFAMFHLKDKLPEQRPILKPETIDLMHRPVAPASYGLGFAVDTNDMGYLRVSHNGGMPGVATAMNFYPTENVAVVVLANTGTRPDFIAQDIMALLLPHYADSLKVRRARKPAPRPAFAPTADLVGDWSGTFRSWKKTVPIRLTLRPDGDILAWVGDQPRAIANQVAFVNNKLTGRFAGAMGTDDAGRWPHDLAMGLLKRDGKLAGWVNAMSLTDPIMYSLSGYAELTKK
jgi:hypothetical protein